jgi:hypothetical protein
MGAALMGFRSLGHNANFIQHGSGSSFSPKAGHRQLYDKMYSIFGRMGNHLMDDFDEIASLQRGR